MVNVQTVVHFQGSRIQLFVFDIEYVHVGEAI